MKPIKKAVFPVAGLGTRFLPATKAMPKEMLTVVDKPLIQIVVEEAREAGIDQLIFVTGRNKGVIERNDSHRTISCIDDVVLAFLVCNCWQDFCDSLLNRFDGPPL